MIDVLPVAGSPKTRTCTMIGNQQEKNVSDVLFKVATFSFVIYSVHIITYFQNMRVVHLKSVILVLQDKITLSISSLFQ